MRIISGSHRGKIITAPKNLPVRPTTDFAKTGLFNILSHKVDFTKITVLDLFSGTGNIAYEFFSRGAQHITCVDKEINCTRFINATAKTLKAENIKTFNENVFRFVESCKQTFDIIFADPPFDFKFYDELIEKILSKNILTPNGIFIVEHSSDLQIENEKFLAEQRKYGHVTFNFYTAAL